MKLNQTTKKRRRKIIRSLQKDGEVEDTLGQRERSFVEQFVTTGDLVESYRDTHKPGRTHKPIDLVKARFIVTLPRVAAAIDEELRKFAKKFYVDRDVAINYVASIALSDTADLFVPGTNQLRPISDMPLHIRRAIQSVQQMQDGSIKVTLASKDKAASLLLQAVGVTGAAATPSGGPSTKVRLAYDRASGRLAVEFKTKGATTLELQGPSTEPEPDLEAEAGDNQ